MGVEAKSSSSGEGRRKTIAPATKVVLRRLPPEMTAELLMEELGAELPPHQLLYVAKGDLFARAYLNLHDPKDLVGLRDRFDGYVFVDSKGGEYPAVVELAPLQKVPDSGRRESEKRQDSKMGTIEEDADFLAFKAALEAEAEEKADEGSPLEVALKEIEDRERQRKEKGPVQTPLVQYMLERQEERFRKALEKRKAKDDDRRTAKIKQRDRDDDRPPKKDADKPAKKDSKRDAEKTKSGREKRRTGDKAERGDKASKETAFTSEKGESKKSASSSEKGESKKRRERRDRPAKAEKVVKAGDKADKPAVPSSKAVAKAAQPASSASGGGAEKAPVGSRPKKDEDAKPATSGKSYAKSRLAKPDKPAESSSAGGGSGEKKAAASGGSEKKAEGGETGSGRGRRNRERPDMPRYTPGSARGGRGRGGGGAKDGVAKPKEST